MFIQTYQHSIKYEEVCAAYDSVSDIASIKELP